MVYYGFPFPNTAYAKMMCTGVPLVDRMSRGIMYAANSFSWDTLSWCVLGLALVLSMVRREAKSQCMICGAILHVLYVIVSAAAATHMSGRFFAVSFLVGALVLVNLLRFAKEGIALAAVSVLFMAWSPISSVKTGTGFYRVPNQIDSFIDTKWFVHREGAALRNFRSGTKMPNHAWYHQGAKFREDPARVHVGGAFHGENLGYFGYAAGPEKHIVDPVGLPDPLMARLPAYNAKRQRWKSGHFHRKIPDGYLESIVESKNLIQDPGLHQYYDRILRITRGPIFEKQRLFDILVVNTGCCCTVTERRSRTNERMSQ
jgi:arabinofuranosyltransferase